MRMRNPNREIRNVFMVKGDADDLAALLKQAKLHPRVYARSLRAELQDTLVYVVVADKDRP